MNVAERKNPDFETIGPEETVALKQDAIAFFHQNKKGSSGGQMGKWGYSPQFTKSDPVCGGLLWDLFTVLHPKYYVKKNQRSLLSNNLGRLHKITGAVHQVLDFGCGGPDAILSQTIPLLREFKEVTTYIPIDINADYAYGAKDLVHEKLDRNIEVLPKPTDFEDLELPKNGKRLGLFLGASTNFENFPSDMEDLMATFHKAVGKGSFLTVCIDTNLDSESIVSSYDHPIHHEQETNLIHRLKRDLNITGDLDPDAWRYETRTEEFEHDGHKILLASHVLVATKPQSFFIDGVYCSASEGEAFVSDKSYKIPVELMDKIAASQGFIRRDLAYDHQDRMALLTYEAI